MEALAPGTVVRDRWTVIKKLGEGGFGAVYEVYDKVLDDNGALKVEPVSDKNQVLKMEVVALRKLSGRQHICRLLGCGRNDSFNYVVMQLVGKSLADLKREAKNQKFTVSTAIRICRQCLRALEEVHSVGFLHRDVKPSNFAMGRPPKEHRTVFVLDFGLARMFVKPTGEMRKPRAAAGFRGTVRYAPVAAHKNQEMGRGEDVWCLFYMCIEMIVGSLPWRKIQKKEEVGQLKESITPQALLRGCPEELHVVYRHLKSLSYADPVDYQLVYYQFDTILQRHGVRHGDPFDWERAGATSAGTGAGMTYDPKNRPASQQYIDEAGGSPRANQPGMGMGPM